MKRNGIALIFYHHVKNRFIKIYTFVPLYHHKQTKKQTMKNRNFTLDLLRVMACYLVIHQHASEFFYIGENGSVVTGDNTFRIGIMTSIARISVPLFVMISGYLLLPMKTTTHNFLKKRFTRILYPFITWCALYAIYYVFTKDETWLQALTHIINIPVNFGVEVGHLWYIYMLIGLYLLVPILSPWLNSCSKREIQGYLLLWGATTLIPYIHIVFPQILGECFWNPTPAFYYFNGFVGYMILGYYIKQYGSLGLVTSLAIAVSGYAVTAYIFCSRINTASIIPELELSWGFCTANIALFAWGTFSLFTHIRWKGNNIAGKIISDISQKSYGMYLAHIMLLNLYYGIFSPYFENTLISVPLISICTFISVYLTIKVLSYIPSSKYWLG